MKNYIVVIILVALFVQCTTDDNSDTNTNEQEIQNAQNVVLDNNWTITSYIDSGENETSDYDGYTFQFNQDGTVVATSAQTSISGNWSITQDSDSDDDNDNDLSDIDFNLFFNAEPDGIFEELNDDCDLISASSTRIELRDISGGDGTLDILIFE